MHRVKIPLLSAVLLLGCMAATYFIVRGTLDEEVSGHLEEGLVRGQNAFAQITRLEVLDFQKLAERFAADEEFGKVFDQPDIQAQRRAAFVAVQQCNEVKLRDLQRKADFFVVVDAAGKVLARNLDPNVMFGEDLKGRYSAVALAVSGQPARDVVTFNGRMMTLVAAPIHRAGQVAGALVIGNIVTTKEAAAKRDLFGNEIAYFMDGKIQASSFTTGDREDSAGASQLSSVLFGGAKVGERVLANATPSDPFQARIGDDDYVAVAAPILGTNTRGRAGFVVLASVSGAGKATSTVTRAVLALGLVGLMVVLFAAIATARRFLVPAEQIEAGVTEVINGNLDYTFKSVGPDLEGLANALNVMLCRLLGRPEPGDDEEGEAEGEGGGSSALFMVAEGDGAPVVVDDAVRRLAAEPEPAYLRRLFDEYVAACGAVGQKPEGLTFETFVARVRQQEAPLRAKYRAAAVRFRVITRGEQVALKPIPLTAGAGAGAGAGQA